jgi:hypothetical protein
MNGRPYAHWSNAELEAELARLQPYVNEYRRREATAEKEARLRRVESVVADLQTAFPAADLAIAKENRDLAKNLKAMKIEMGALRWELSRLAADRGNILQAISNAAAQSRWDYTLERIKKMEARITELSEKIDFADGRSKCAFDVLLSYTPAIVAMMKKLDMVPRGRDDGH